MSKNRKSVIIFLAFLLMIIIVSIVYGFTKKSTLDSKVSDNNLAENENHEKKETPFSHKELSDMALEYFYKRGSNLLSKTEYNVGISENVIPKYQNQDMVVVEIRHINGSINTLDARYFINIYNARGFDMDENEIDLNE